MKMSLKTTYFPPENEWESLCLRPSLEIGQMNELIEVVFSAIQAKGDEAIRYYTSIFEKRNLSSFRVDEKMIEASVNQLSNELKEAITIAATNIRNFHQHYLKPDASPIETSQGVVCWQKRIPLKRVGLYVPGGTAPLFSTVLMLGIPAQIAGCKEIVICSPAGRSGALDPAVLYAAKASGVKEIYTVGGAHAIAAMAIGTQSINRVDKIFGPGNQYVMAAKQYAATHFCPIDLPAGPSEVLVIADATADPVFVAADLLAQAEHGSDSQVLLASTSAKLIEEVNKELHLQLDTLPRAAIATAALANSHALLFDNLNTAMQFSNTYAPEHLIIAAENAEALAEQVLNAGSVFIGHYTPESAGDYASGTNHTLPTNGFARSLSGLTAEAFTKTISFQYISDKGIKQLGPVIEVMANAENLIGHSNAVRFRLEKLKTL